MTIKQWFKWLWVMLTYDRNFGDDDDSETETLNPEDINPE